MPVYTGQSEGIPSPECFRNERTHDIGTEADGEIKCEIPRATRDRAIVDTKRISAISQIIVIGRSLPIALLMYATELMENSLTHDFVGNSGHDDPSNAHFMTHNIIYIATYNTGSIRH